MRFFLCAFEGFSLGIPASAVSSLIISSQEEAGILRRDPVTGDVYFSAPSFLGFPEQAVRHGLILKPQVLPVPLIPRTLPLESAGILPAEVLPDEPEEVLPAEPAEVLSGEPAEVLPDEPEEGEKYRNILLVTAVERAADIPPEEIHPLPAILAEQEQAAFYMGARFDGSAVTLFVNPAKLMVQMLKAAAPRESL
jgi:hypothetical protein